MVSNEDFLSIHNNAMGTGMAMQAMRRRDPRDVARELYPTFGSSDLFMAILKQLKLIMVEQDESGLVDFDLDPEAFSSDHQSDEEKHNLAETHYRSDLERYSLDDLLDMISGQIGMLWIDGQGDPDLVEQLCWMFGAKIASKIQDDRVYVVEGLIKAFGYNAIHGNGCEEWKQAEQRFAYRVLDSLSSKGV